MTDQKNNCLQRDKRVEQQKKDDKALTVINAIGAAGLVFALAITQTIFISH